MFRRRPRVSRLEQSGDVPRLIAALQFRDITVDGDRRPVDVGVAVRSEAAAALGRTADRAAIDALGVALSDDAQSVRRNALGALTGFREPKTVDLISDAMLRWSAPEDETLRSEALQHLEDGARVHGEVAYRVALRYLDGAPGDDAAGEEAVLSVLARATDEHVRSAVVAAATHFVASPHPVSRTRATRLLEAMPDESIGALQTALHHDDKRDEAVRVLGELHDSSSTPALLELLRDGDTATRSSAARALGQILDPQAAEALLEAASDRDHGVRAAAIEALRELGPAGTLYGFAAIARSLLPELGQGERANGLVRLLAAAQPPEAPVNSTADDVQEPQPREAEPEAEEPDILEPEAEAEVEETAQPEAAHQAEQPEQPEVEAEEPDKPEEPEAEAEEPEPEAETDETDAVSSADPDDAAGWLSALEPASEEMPPDSPAEGDGRPRRRLFHFRRRRSRET